jgi:hypothetical protein
MRVITSAISTQLTQLHRLLKASKHWLAAHKDACRGASSLRRALTPLERALVNPPVAQMTRSGPDSAVAAAEVLSGQIEPSRGNCNGSRRGVAAAAVAGGGVVVAARAALVTEDLGEETELMQAQELGVVTQVRH